MSQITFPRQTRPNAQAGGTADPGQPGEAQLRSVREHRSFASFRSIGALILREMATTYGRTPAGYFWAVAEPVGGILLLTVIFSAGFRLPPIGTNFAIFYATGMIPFLAYMSTSNKISNSITYSKPLLAYPAVTFMDAVLGRIFVNVVMQLLVAYLIFTGIMLIWDTRTDPQILGIALSFGMAFIVAIGVGAVNCFLFEAFPFWQSVWSIASRPLFMISCIFFIFDDLPDWVQRYLWYNPLVHVVGQMRKSFYPNYRGDYVSPVYCFAVGLTLTAVGFFLLHRYHRDLQNS